MRKCPVSGCGLFHDRMLNCKVAANQFRAGTLAEPWLTANRLEELKKEKVVPTSGGMSPEVVATPSEAQRVSLHVNEPVVDRIEPVRNAQHETAGKPKRWDKAAYNAYMREYMRAWRAKK